jgi:dGTPase
LHALKSGNKESEIYKHFLNSKSEKYFKNNSDELIVRDFLAGMTDRYFTQVLEKLIVPQMADLKIMNE